MKVLLLYVHKISKLDLLLDNQLNEKNYQVLAILIEILSNEVKNVGVEEQTADEDDKANTFFFFCFLASIWSIAVNVK